MLDDLAGTIFEIFIAFVSSILLWFYLYLKEKESWYTSKINTFCGVFMAMTMCRFEVCALAHMIKEILE